MILAWPLPAPPTRPDDWAPDYPRTLFRLHYRPKKLRGSPTSALWASAADRRAQWRASKARAYARKKLARIDRKRPSKEHNN